MRRIALIALALLVASAFFLPPLSLAQDKGDPTKPVEPPPVEEPTKPPPPPEGQEPEKTPTPEFAPTKTPTPVNPPTKPALSTVEGTATWGPTAKPLTTATEMVEPTAVPTDMPAPTATPEPTATEIVLQVIGVVFDDADGDGWRDVNETGVAGVPVVVEDGGEQKTVVTDTGGTYTAQVSPTAVVKVVPPAGWRAPGLAALPAPKAGDFPLRRLEGAANAAVASSSAPVAPVTITQSALDLTGIAAGFAVLGVLVWVGLLGHRRAIVKAYQSWALADLRLRHEAESESRQFTVESDDEALVVLEQAALDATGTRPFITHLVRDRSRISPVAAIVAFSASNSRHWVFSPASTDQLKRLGHDHLVAVFGKDGRRGIKAHLAVDALNSSPFVADNLAAVLRYLAADASSPLPRAEQWHVYVVEPRKSR